MGARGARPPARLSFVSSAVALAAAGDWLPEDAPVAEPDLVPELEAAASAELTAEGMSTP